LRASFTASDEAVTSTAPSVKEPVRTYDPAASIVMRFCPLSIATPEKEQEDDPSERTMATALSSPSYEVETAEEEASSGKVSAEEAVSSEEIPGEMKEEALPEFGEEKEQDPNRSAPMARGKPLLDFRLERMDRLSLRSGRFRRRFH
jgi:hypothetical protein